MVRFGLGLMCALLVCACVSAQQIRNEYVTRGNANLSRGDIDGAITNYDKALELQPGSAEAHYKRGQARKAKGNLDGAIEDYQAAVSIDASITNSSDIADAYYNRGFIKSNGLDLEEAIADFDMAIKFNPKDANSFIKRGEAHLVMGNRLLAISDFDQTIALHPAAAALSFAYADKGYANLLLDRVKEARAAFALCLGQGAESRFLIELHLRLLEAQITEIKHQRTSVLQWVA